MDATRGGTEVLERTPSPAKQVEPPPPSPGQVPGPEDQDLGVGGFFNWLARRKASRLVTVLAVITIGALVAMSTITIASSYSALSDSARKRLVDNSSLLGVFVATTLVATGVQVETAYAGRPALVAALGDGNHARFDHAALAPLLKDLRYVMPAIHRVFITDLSGRYWADSDPAVAAPATGSDYSSQDWYQGVQRSHSPYTSTGFLTPGQNPPMSVAIAVPIRADGRNAPTGTVIGMLVGVLPQGTPDALFATYPDQQPVDIQLTDQKGYIVESSSGTPSTLVRDDSPGVAAALRGRHTTSRLKINGKDSFAAYAPVPLIGWTMRASVPTSAALSDANQLLVNVLVIGCILVALMVFTKIVLYLMLRNLQTARVALATANATLEDRVSVRTAELEAANQKLEASNRELAASNKQLEEFSFSVSHDLRAPLRGIDGFTQIVLDEESGLSPQSMRMLGRVRDNTAQMGQLIDELLGFSRLNHVEFRKQRVEPGPIVAEVIAALREDNPGRVIEVSVGELPACQADPERLAQVLRNLLSNAVTFTGPRPVARIEVTSVPTVAPDPPGMVTYLVRDNGIGFDMRYAGKLFEPFERLHTDPQFAGSGVGLALVKRIVERHGGRIWADAAVDAGASFYFTLDSTDDRSTA